MDSSTGACSNPLRYTVVSYPDSPPSLIYSEFGSEDIDEIMASVDREDCSATMAKLLDHLDRVVEHLRDKGDNEAANQIAQCTYTIIHAFNNATAAWDLEKFLMNAPIVHHRDPTPSGRVSAVPQYKQFPGESWAAVAATAAAGDSHVVTYKPSDVLQRTGSTRAAIPPDEPTSEVDLRVVWVQPWDPIEPLSKITAAILQGPLLSVAYSRKDQSVCIIFQHPQHAQNFLQHNQEFSERCGHGLFGANKVLLTGGPYVYHEGLDRMEPPANERRRLTFARSQLFTGNLTEAQFKQDLVDLVGEENLELVWLFNSGNATAVFSATCMARTVRNHFRKRARQAGPYKDIQVSFSHDPCERPMHLVTQMHNGQNTHRVQNGNGYGYGYSNPSSHPGGHVAGPGGGTNAEPLRAALLNGGRNRPLQHKKVDSDGWQTVGRRR